MDSGPELLHDRERRPAVADDRARPENREAKPGTLDPPGLARMQRSAGNAAVALMVQRSVAAAPRGKKPVPLPLGQVVQPAREGAEETQGDESAPRSEKTWASPPPEDGPNRGLAARQVEAVAQRAALLGYEFASTTGRLTGAFARGRVQRSKDTRGGQGLPDSGRRIGEVYGRDFSNVRVHSDTGAAAIASAEGARALTFGRDIAFAAGEYRPGTPGGDALLAHELAHVAQQDAPVGGEIARLGDGSGAEPDANASAARAFLSLWGKAGPAAREVARNAGPQLKTGLQLHRCSGSATAPTVTANSVQFKGGHPLATTATDPKANPIWRPGAADHAAAFTIADAPKVSGSFGVSPAPDGAAGSISVRVKEGGVVRGTKGGVTPGAVVDVNDLTLTGLTGSDAVRASTYNLDWEASEDGTSWTPLVTTGPHPIYWLFGSPRVAPARNSAVSRAVGWAAGAPDAATAAPRIRAGIRGSVNYDPADPINPDPLTVFDDGIGICTDFGNLLTLLALSIGLNANSVMFFGGFISKGKNVWASLGGALGNLNLVNVKSPNPAYNPPPTAISPLGWAFNYHVISRIEGALHDAALDRAGYDAEAAHAGKVVHLVELDPAGPPDATMGTSYGKPIPRKDHVVAVTVRDYGQQITGADFGDVFPLPIPSASPSPVEVAAMWAVTGGVLPRGLTLKTATGVLTGKPMRRGTFPVTITVIVGGGGLSETAVVTVKVK